jgi:hypothetical protein
VVPAASKIWAFVLKKKATNISETPVNLYQITRSNTAEDSHLSIRRRENLKSQALCDSKYMQSP